jgi:cephalosporin-C deacetylase-like acetyl esterase
LIAVMAGCLALPPSALAQALPGTKLLEGKEDFAKVMVEGIDRYLTKVTQDHVAKRTASWKPDVSSGPAYAKSLEPQRQRLRKILGVIDQRLPPAMEYVGTTDRPALLGDGGNYQVYAVRWPVLPGVYGEGLLLEPKAKAKACVVAIPDADQTPEGFAGLVMGDPMAAPTITTVAANEVRVIIPTLIDRKDTWSGSEKLGRFTNQTHREFIYRMAFEMGRHIIGYEVQKVLAAVDWFCKDKDHLPVGVFGYGEGGLVALYSAAIDPRIEAAVVSGYFGPREKLCDEPIYRNVWGLLREFGDAEIARLIAPRSLVIEPSDCDPGPPPKPGSGRGGAAPGLVKAPSPQGVRHEFKRVFDVDQAHPLPHFALPTELIRDDERLDPPLCPGRSNTTSKLLASLNKGKPIDVGSLNLPKQLELTTRDDPEVRQHRQFDELVAFTQDQLGAAVKKRQDFFWSKLDTSSLDKFQKSQEPLRDYFWNEVIGKLPEPTMPPNVRTRLIYDEPKWKGYEVVMDLYDDVICYGILLVPNDIKPGERRPAVVCQHGLEGRPTDVCNPKERTKYYNSFGAQLADRGFVVFAPQNPYIFGNQFRQFVRKANPMQLHIYSFIVRQHERILQWLGTLPFVDPARIAYYGLSYGGKVAMRIPSILLGYCLSICSGDFNEWIWKNITLDWQGSYMFGGEYEMVEFDLGNTFNYAEMAALIAPRPFMVERGHSDGVGLDEYVAFEYAKVRRLYATLGIADRTEIEFFVGGHVIHGQGTFAFLHRHLNWPAPK